MLPNAADLSRPVYGATFTEAYSRFWRKYAMITGRASRSEYWWAVLANLLIVFGLAVAGTASDRQGAYFFGVLYLLFFVAVIVPSLTVTVRRLHDAGLSGWFYLLTFVPVIGQVPLMFMLAQASALTGARFDTQAAGSGTPPSSPRDRSDPMLPPGDRSARSAVSSPAGRGPSQSGSDGLDRQVAAPAFDGSRGGMGAIIAVEGAVIVVVGVAVLAVIGAFWLWNANARPQATAASGSAVNDGPAVAIRARLQGTPDWHLYKDDVFFKWDPNPQCVGMLSCSGIDVETASSLGCSYGSVVLDLLRNGTVVDTRQGSFQSLSAGIPKLVQVYWNPNVTGDHVQVNKISCGN